MGNNFLKNIRVSSDLFTKYYRREEHMRALIVYGTRYGMTKLTTDTISEELKTKYNFDITISENRLSRDLKMEVGNFDLIVAGSSIVSGFWKSGVKRFLKKYCANNKNVAIFVTAGGTLYYAKDKGLTKEEAIEKAKEKYIIPLIKKYKLTPLILGAFGGQYKQRNKVRFNNWDKDDILKWTDEMVQAVMSRYVSSN